MTTSPPSSVQSKLSRVSPLSVALVLLFAAVMTYFLIRALAASGTATLYTSPSGTQAVTNGQTFTINVRVSTAGNVPVTGASTYLSYPAGKLQVIGQNYTGSPYNTQLAASDSGGVLRMDRAAFPMISGGDQLFAQVTFKAIATGSAPITFTSSSVVTSGEDDSNILTQRNGVTYNISAPPSTGGGGSSTPPASGGGQTTGGSSGGSRPSTPTPSGKPGSGGTGNNSSGGTASGSSTSSTTSGSDASTGGSTGSSDSSATGTASAVSGLEIAVVDANKRPVKGATVTVNGQTARTDSKGIARFENVTAGKQKVTVQYNGKKVSQTVRVKNDGSKAPQLVKVSMVQDKLNPGLLLAPVVIVALAAVFFLRPWDRKFAPVMAKEDLPQVVSSGQPHDTPTAPAGRKLETPGTVYSPTPQDKDGSPPK